MPEIKKYGSVKINREFITDGIYNSLLDVIKTATEVKQQIENGHQQSGNNLNYLPLKL